MKIFGKTIHIHKWNKLLIKKKYEFRNRPCTKDVETNYRYCKECRAIQEYKSGSWKNVPEGEKEILLEDIVFKRKVNKDEYAYFLTDKNLKQNN